MWLNAGHSDELSQGDLLRDIPFPKLKLGLQTLEVATKPHSVIELQIQPAIVVTQDCIIDKEHVRHIALAPIRPEGGLNQAQVDAIWAPEPPTEGVGDLSGYVYDYFAVNEHSELPKSPPNGLLVSDLKRIQPFEGPREDFVNRRVARMAVESVRLLRINLASFWGRPSEEHAEQLEQLGIPPGIVP